MDIMKNSTGVKNSKLTFQGTVETTCSPYQVQSIKSQKQKKNKEICFQSQVGKETEPHVLHTKPHECKIFSLKNMLLWI